MNRDRVEKAKAEALRFLEAVEKVEENFPEYNRWAGHTPFGCGTKDTGALRRASLELTRALAEMRKP